MDTKVCSKCGKEKITADFTQKGLRLDGSPRFDSHCKACYALKQKHRRAKARQSSLCTDCGRPSSTYRCQQCQKIHIRKNTERRHQKKKRVIDYLGGKCCRCGMVSPIVDVYDIHHEDGDKETEICKLLNKRGKWEDLVPELDKCVLLCANCHRRLHYSTRVLSNRLKTISGNETRRHKKEKAVQNCGGKCNICNTEFDFLEAYDFHHRDGDAGGVSMARWFTIKPYAEIQRELSKCILLCANCHRSVHYEERK